MKAKQIFEKLIENWQAKAVCFVIALFLYIFNQQSGVSSRTIKTNVAIETDSGFKPAEAFNTSISLSLRGKKENISTLSSEDFEAYLDFSYVAKDGKYDFPVMLKLSAAAAAINPLEIKVIPEKITLNVEEETAGFVKVEPLIKGEAPHGYQIDSIKIEPEEVKIRGAKSLVENCTSMQTENIVLTNARTSFSGSAKIVNWKKNISLETSTISYTVQISETASSKTFKDIPVTPMNLLNTLEITSIPKKITFVLEGPLLSLEALTDLSSVCRADLSSVIEAGTFSVPVKYTLPARLRLSEAAPKTVSVTVAEKTKDAENTDSEMMEKITTIIDSEER